jgi:hypothetical protein
MKNVRSFMVVCGYYAFCRVYSGERCLVTQNSNLTIKARKKWTIRESVAELEA